MQPKNPIRAIRYCAKVLLDFILPRSCLVCGRKLLANETDLCIYCMADLPLTYNWNLPYNEMADRFNEMLQTGLPAYEPYSYAAALFRYDDRSGYDKITQALKYDGKIATGRLFGRILGGKLAMSPLYADVDVVIPVPLHWKRKWKRGYNQAAILGKAIAEMLGVQLRTDILYRNKSTASQTELGIKEKKENVRNAFAARQKQEYSFRHILLTDDVFTTGATLASCHSALRKIFSGKVRISVATLAVVEET